MSKPIMRRWVVTKRGRGPLRYWVKLAPSGSYGPAEEPPRQGEMLMPAKMPLPPRKP